MLREFPNCLLEPTEQEVWNKHRSALRDSNLPSIIPFSVTEAGDSDSIK